MRSGGGRGQLNGFLQRLHHVDWDLDDALGGLSLLSGGPRRHLRARSPRSGASEPARTTGVRTLHLPPRTSLLQASRSPQFVHFAQRRLHLLFIA
jgi:hypothetical protein